MNRFLYILTVFSTLLLWSCKQEDAEEIQRKTIENAIDNTYQSVDGIYFKRLRHPLCDTIIEQDGVDITLPECRHISNGSSILLHYSAKVFKGELFATSFPDDAKEGGIDMMPPLQMTVGTTPIVEGVQRALMQMVIGDSVHVIFPFTLGYGEKEYVGSVPPMSAHEWTLVTYSSE